MGAMGAKNPANVKDKRTIIVCEECQREFLTIRALKSHTMAKHPDNYKQMQNVGIENKDDKKTAFVPPTSRASKRLQQKMSVDRENTSEDSSSSVPDRRKVVFECPECLRVFSVYFRAFKHIQKNHSVDKDGNPVPVDSSTLIKPVRKEICTTCEKPVFENEHICGDISTNPDNVILQETHDKGTYSCLGCKNRKFESVASFDDHVARTHNKNADIFIFGNNNEFLEWKTKLESQVHVKYLTLSNTTQKQYYQCNYVSPKNSADITHLCPSMMIVRDFSKGIHIRYYKDHHGHQTPKPIKDNDELFNSLMKKDDVDDLYTKFKNLLKSISLGASKISVTNLTKLYIAALEMQTSLNTYKNLEENAGLSRVKTRADSLDAEDKESVDSIDNYDREEAIHMDSTQKSSDAETYTTTNKSMNDDQITKILEAPRASARLKRKSESSSVVVPKKTKLDADKDVSKTQPALENKLNKDSKFLSPRITKSSPLTQSPSFNDTYKQFIDSTLPPKDEKNLTKGLVPKVDKKANSSPTLKVGSTIIPQLDKEVEIAIPTVDKKVESTNKAKIDKKTYVTPKSKVDKKITSPNTKKKGVKKVIVKTKMGQFIQSPKKTKLMTDDSEKLNISYEKKKKTITSARPSIANINLEEIEYEVVEQENDCNILVLKI